MFQIFEKILFFLFVLPFLMIEKGYFMLNEYLEKRGLPKIDWMYVLVVFLILVVIILWAIGFRW